MLESPRCLASLNRFLRHLESMPLTALRPTLPGVLTSALALWLGLAVTHAHGLGLGRPQMLSGLGRPLDVVVPVSLSDGEALPDGCVRAEVVAGEARVPAGLLQSRIEVEGGAPRIRLQSLVRIEEPALRITLAVGCPLRLTREFNVFIDPPVTGSASAPAAIPVPPPAAAPAPVPVPVPVQAPAADTTRAVLVAAPPASAASAAKPRPRPRPKPSGPRLVLERPEVLVAAPSPRQAPARADEGEMTPELEAQITQLEQTVAQLRAELEARLQAEAASAPAAASAASAAVVAEAASAAMPEASAPAATVPRSGVPRSRATPAYRDPMIWLLTLGLSLLAGAVTFYGSRWRDERARRERAYWRALHAAEGGGLPPAPAPAPVPAPAPGMAPLFSGQDDASPHETHHPSTRPQPRPMAWPPAPLVAAPAPVPALADALERTQILPRRPDPAAVIAQELTLADQLLDLQQQVDFLQLLGQQDTAAELLAGLLRQGQSGPMPYLMLMELCQQRGDTEVFQELARQYERYFKLAAPEWQQSLSRGRTLDASASVIAHLQVVWSEPSAALHMVQDLLAKGRGPGTPYFDLPAYRDLLMLYGVARDLFESGLRGDGVDLMLPLDSTFGARNA